MGLFESSASGRRYRLLAELARGGMGHLFVGQEVGPKARGEALVAVKTLLPEAARDSQLLGRFLDEAQLSARLEHPNIAALQDFGVAAERPFAVFELLEGADLGAVLDALIEKQLELPVSAALALAIECCAGLHHAHALTRDGKPLGVIHRDLSPSNLFLTSDGQVKVLDFGAAWRRDRIVQTVTGGIIGKLQYMSPEQVKAEKIDARSDVFALGLCLHELLTLRPAYEANGERELVALVYDGRVPPVQSRRMGLPPALCAAIRAATEADAANRPSSAEAFARALRATPVKPATREQLADLYEQLFGTARTNERRARLRALAARPHTDDALPFVWEASPLIAGETAVGVAVSSGDVRIASESDTPQQPLRPPDPETDRADAQLDRPTRADRMPRVEPKPATRTTPALHYALFAAALLIALLLGVLIGRAR